MCIASVSIRLLSFNAVFPIDICICPYAGRTGRAGRAGTAVTYFTDDDVGYVKPIATMVNQSNIQQAAFSNAHAKTNLEPGTMAEAIAAPTSAVPEWMLKLRKPGGNMRKQVRTKPIGRKDVKAVANGRADKDLAWKKKMERKKKGRAKPSNRKEAVTLLSGGKSKAIALDEESE